MQLLETCLHYLRAWFAPAQNQLQPIYIPVETRRVEDERD